MRVLERKEPTMQVHNLNGTSDNECKKVRIARPPIHVRWRNLDTAL